MTRILGFRGTCLVLLGSIWVLLGLGITSEPANRPPMLHLLIPAPIGILLWLTTAGIAIYFGLRRNSRDGFGWVALYFMPALRVVSYFIAWLDYHFHFAGAGLERGWLSALIYLALVLIVGLCARWPNPVTPPREVGRDG